MAQLASDLAPTLAELARSLTAPITDGTLDPAVEVRAAIARADGDRGAATAVAAQLAGRPLGLAQLAPLTTLFDEPLIYFAVARATAEGPIALFVEAAARWLPHDEVGDRLSILGLWGAMRLGADEATVRRRIVPLLRSLARRRQSPIEEALLATVAAELQHADLLELAARGEPHRGRDDVKQNIAAYEKDLTAEPLTLLAPFAWVGGGATAAPVVRAAPKAGRNDPCPCGSGKKYKKCCLEKDEAGAVAEAAAPPTEPTRARSGRRLTKKEIAKLSVPELVELDLATLETERLGDVSRAFVDVRRLQDAERCLAELARRGDEKALAERRDELLFRAAELGDADCLARQLALVDDRALRFPHDVTLALLRRDEQTLETLLGAVDRAARDSASAEELALAVLRAHPALGILLARGAFGAMQRSEVLEVLLEEVEYARDALDLRGADPAWRLYDLVAARDEEEASEEAAERAAEERARAVAEAAELRKSMKLQAAQLQKLENRLRSREEALAIAKQSTRRVRAPGEPDPDEQKRLRQKIAELKARVKESNEERAALKRALAEAQGRAPEEAPPVAADPDDSDDADELAGDEATAPRALLVPQFTARATDALARITDRVAADALRTVGALAARDDHAWRGVKRAKDMPREILMARLGIHHRLIFSTDRGPLEILDIVPREGLDLALKRLRSL